jgi:hypothetical protein
LADVQKRPLDLVDVLSGSSVRRRERSLASRVDLVSVGVGGFHTCQGSEAASAGCVCPKLGFVEGFALHELGAQVGDAIWQFEASWSWNILMPAFTCL